MPLRRSCNHIPSSPPPQGIVTILGADCDTNTKPGSIRRTLSADMSSKKWLHQNGFPSLSPSPIKKIVSSQEIAAMAPDDDDFHHHPNQDEVWNSIQSQSHKETGGGAWGLILTQKSDNSLLQTPYVHPMVKRSKSSLSDKSLEICTESLGSETGSDCFSSDDDDRQTTDTEDHLVKIDHHDYTSLHVIKNKKSPPRSFPPPLPSVAAGDLHMQSRRENGRLLLEAVSVQPRNYFLAQRQNGRLLLTLNHAPANLEFEEDEGEEEVQFGDVEEMLDRGGGCGAAVVERKEESLVEQNLSHLPTGMISVHKSVLMKKLMVVGNINPKWSDDMATRDGEDQIVLPVSQSLPPRRPPVAPRTSSFNTYEYFWRKPGFATTSKNKNKNKNKMNQDLVMYMRGCKEARKSLFAPYCIATS